MRFPLVLSLIAGLAGCVPFKAESPRIDHFPFSVAHGGILLSAMPYDTLESQWEVFDADMVRAGILPIYVQFTNQRPQAVQVQLKSIALYETSGHKRHPFSPEKAAGTMLERYSVRYYSRHSYQRFLERLKGISFREAFVSPGHSVAGFVYFPYTREAASLDVLGARVPLRSP